MIRWYDYVAAIVFAYGLYGWLSVPYFGWLMVWASYELGWKNGYCEWRKYLEA